MEKKSLEINPEKAASRVAINAFMISSLFIILTLILTLGINKFNFFIVWQLFLATPLLFISSLAYTKVSYRENPKIFDRFRWISHTLGNNMILNAFGLMIGSTLRSLSIVYFCLTFVVILLYYTIDSYHDPSQAKEDTIKIIFIFIVLLIGGIYPLVKI